ncbi:hypothetical protein BAUR9175_03771 [Brevibacterium aurantiacum]|uniref:Uncharacterized protein n=1 Tax=Brevibacterium aurantiacum TaxID=273384 RepID=A0A2H1KRS5_BREAU|nr:hypothetical protein BAUR9175_03771 [Brevibacterium aurantiacum]
MIPESKGAKIAYIAVASVSILLVGFCIFVWLWAGTIEDGWISAYVAAVVVSVVCVPIALVPLGWSLGLSFVREAEKRKSLRNPAKPHAELCSMNSPIEIRFFPDWGRKEPLWSHDTDDIAVGTSDLPISADLADDLHACMDFWSSHFNPVVDYPDSGWDSEENHQWFIDEGNRLIRELSSELEGRATISDERDPDDR